MKASKINELKRWKKAAEDAAKLQKKWEDVLAEEGLTMNCGISNKLSYAGTIAELVVIEKLN